MITATARTVVRLRIQRQLHLDDAFLLVACVLLTAVITVLYTIEPALNRDILFFQNRGALPEFTGRVTKYEKYLYSQMTLTWMTIFAVKFSFLSFFRHLVDRMTKLVIFWRVVVAVTSLSLVICACSHFVRCPYFGMKSSRYFSMPMQAGEVIGTQHDVWMNRI